MRYCDYSNKLFDLYHDQMQVQPEDDDVMYAVVIDLEKYCWGFVHKRLANFIFLTGEKGDRLIVVPLMEDWYDKWFK